MHNHSRNGDTNLMRKLIAIIALLICAPLAVAQLLMQQQKLQSVPSFTLVQHVVKDCANVATCTATVSSTGSGNVITVTLSHYNLYTTANNPIFFSSATDSVGTCTYQFIPSAWTEQSGNGNGYLTNLHAVCLNSASGATTVSMTITGTLNSGATSSMEVNEWTPSGGTPALDAGNTGPFTPCTSCATPTRRWLSREGWQQPGNAGARSSPRHCG